MPTFAAYLQPLLREVPRPLLGTSARERMLTTAALLPGDFAFQTFGFECPLHEEAPHADLLVSAGQARGGAAALAATPWQSARTLGAALDTPGAAIDDVWLEFDLFGASPDQPNLFCRPLAIPAEANAARERLAATAVLLTGAPLPVQLNDAVMRAAARLPERATIFQIGAMRARPTAGLRLCVNEIALDGILDWLDALGYADIGGVRALLVRFQPALGDVTVAVDLAPDLGAKIGLECYFAPSRRGQPPGELLERFLARLDALGACTAAKAKAIRDYERTISIDADADWPRELLATRRVLGGAYTGEFRRSVHHVKLVHQPGERLQAKAYLAIRHAVAG